MSIRNQNWYNLQSTRRYPLDETSTGDGDDGTTIRDDIIVDCHIRFPRTYGEYLYVQGITVSAGLVTVLFGAADNVQATTGVTIAAVSVPKPAASNVNYAVSGLIPGVSGWVVLGPGIDTNFVGRYTKPIQSLVSPRCGRPLRALPVSTIGKLGVATSMQGLVTLTATTPVTVTYRENAGDVTLGYSTGVIGQAKQALVFELDRALTTDTYNPLALFLGPCGQRPESGTCPKTAIESINGIAPDCNGNIQLEFPGFFPQPITGCNPAHPERCCGIDVLSDLSLSETCLAGVTDPRKEFNDICCTPQPDKPVDEYCWADPVPTIDVVVDELLDFNYTCATLPVCVDFASCGPSGRMLTAAGAFTAAQTNAPNLCNSTTTAGNHFTYASTGNGINIALFKNCTSDWALNRTISAQLKISSKGVDRNGGVVLNYRQVIGTSSISTTYIAVMLDVNRSRLRVLRYTGSSFIEEHFVTVRGKVNTWYTVYATPVANGDGTVTLNFAVAELNAPGVPAVNGSVTLSNYGTPTGQAGIFARQSYSYFNQFRIN
jgi:hypothetical protein